MLILHRLLAALVLVAMAKAEDTGSQKKEDVSESVSKRKAIVQETYQQIEEAADRLLANGDSLWKIKQIVEEKRSSAKIADFNRRIKRMLGPSTTVEVRFVRYSYDETVFGDEKHFLVWDFLKATDQNSKDNDAHDAEVSSYRFSLFDPLEEKKMKLPGDWGELEFGITFITYWKNYSIIGEWMIPCLSEIHRVEMMNRMMAERKAERKAEESRSFDVAKTLAQMEKHRDEVDAVAQERFEELKAETPEFSYATAVPGLFREMRDTLGVLETDVEKALEAIQSLASYPHIYFEDIFEPELPEDEKCQSCNS